MTTKLKLQRGIKDLIDLQILLNNALKFAKNSTTSIIYGHLIMVKDHFKICLSMIIGNFQLSAILPMFLTCESNQLDGVEW